MPKESIYPPEFLQATADRYNLGTTRLDVKWVRSCDSIQIGSSKLDENATNPKDDFFSDGDGLVKPVWNGIFVNLDRNSVNDLIRVLRRARDQAFGRDE